MTEREQWNPPSWARLIAYLAGIAFFVVQPTVFGPPHFGLLAIDAIVLIGVSEFALKQLATLLGIILGRIPPQPQSSQHDQQPKSSNSPPELPPAKESQEES